MYETSVLCTAPVEFLAEACVVIRLIVLHERLCRAGASDIQRSRLLHDSLVSCLNAHKRCVLIELNGRSPIGDRKFVVILLHGCSRMGITL